MKCLILSLKKTETISDSILRMVKAARLNVRITQYRYLCCISLLRKIPHTAVIGQFMCMCMRKCLCVCICVCVWNTTMWLNYKIKRGRWFMLCDVTLANQVHALRCDTCRSISWKFGRNIGYPPETHIIIWSREILSTYDLLLSQIVLKFCTEHGSITAVLCANFQNDLTNGMDVLDEGVSVRFPFNIRFGQIYFIATIPMVLNCTLSISTVAATAVSSKWSGDEAIVTKSDLTYLRQYQFLREPWLTKIPKSA